MGFRTIYIRIRRLIISAARRALLPWRRKVHVSRRGELGDVLLCTPGLRALKDANPRCRVHFYTDIPDLVRGLPYIDEILPSDRRPRRTMLMRYEESIKPRRHLAQILGTYIGARVTDVRPDCPVDESMVEQFRAAWRDLPRPYIIIQRRAGPWTPNKNWPDEYWEKLVPALLKSGSVIEIGAPAVEALVAPNFIDLRGKTNISELIAAIKAADMLVGPVSGPMHIAAAVGTPAVVILGGYELAENAATYPGNQVFYTPIECSPCWLRMPCPIDRECLRRIKPEAVERAVWDIWAETAAPTIAPTVFGGG
jgi:ADP-heptose:LPS heptosyltransferase